MRKKLVSMMMACLVMATTIVPALAVDAGNLQSVDASATEASTIYPKQVQYPVEENGLIYKTYVVKTDDEINFLNRGAIQYNGRTYNYLDMTVEPIETHDEKEYTKTVTGDALTSDKASILAAIDAEIEETTEDGYTGTLKVDKDSLTTTATGYKSVSSVKSITKTYPGISDGDLSIIPKTTTSGGTTYSLTGCTWAEDATYNPYDSDIGTRFTATATYSARVAYKTATEFTYSVDYVGTVVKDEVTGYNCTIMFAPEEAPSHWYDVFMNKDGSTNGVMVFFTILFIAALVGLAIMLVNYVIPSKKGQTVTVEEVVETPK